jgi:hypothetical protein
MLIDEMGRPATSIPIIHPDMAKFSSDRSFQGEIFDLIFCGAIAQRAHTRAGYRESSEPVSLVTSQLVVALQGLCNYGLLVLVMHKPEGLDTISVVRAFTEFSNVHLFKPKKKHAVRSSFYMVAREVNLQSGQARLAILR